MKKVLTIVLILCLLLGLTACGGNGGDDLVNPNTGAIYPNRWYGTKALDGLESYNCVVTDAFLRNAGGVYATYLPFCKDCHEKGWSGSAILSEDEPYETTWSCDCGTRTPIRIRYN